MDVLQLLGEQQATNRANFAQSQADRAELAATRPQQQTAQGRDANSGSMAVSSDGDEARLIGSRITSGLIKPGQSVRVNADGGTVTVDQKPAAHSRPSEPNASPVVKGNIKLLFSVNNPDGVQLWLCGWQAEAVLAFTVPKGGTLHAAVVDNLGGDAWGVNVCWRKAGIVTVEYISSNENDNWSKVVPAILSCAGYGFWFGFYGNGGQGSYHVETSGTYPPIFDRYEYYVFPSQFFYALFNQTPTQLYIPGYSQTIHQHISINDGESYTTGPVNWKFQTIAIPGDLTFKNPLLVTHDEEYDEYAARSTIEIPGVGLDYHTVSVNADGSAGFGYRYTTPSAGKAEYLWYQPKGFNTKPIDDLEVGYYTLLDVFEDNFTTVDLENSPAGLDFYEVAYIWTEAKTFNLRSYSSTFDLIETIEVLIQQADLDYPDNQPPVFYSGSYHP